MTGLVAIHQPNFFPWLGYFDKIRRADTFIFLDGVDYPRAGSGGMGSWTNRVQLSVAGEAQWVTCPLRRLKRGETILAAEIDDSQPWRRKLVRTLEANYGRAAQFSRAMEFLLPILERRETSLVAFNIAAVRAIASRLDITTRFVRQSEIGSEGRATERLISLVKAVGGDAYLAGGGAAGYQQDELFSMAGIDLVYQGFVPRPYGRPECYLPGLSVIDYLMHDGRPLAEAFPDGMI